MADGRVDYRGMDYQQIYQAWLAQASIAVSYQVHELETIHRRWKRLGKLAAAGRL